MPGFRPTVPSMISGAGLPTSVIAVSSAEVPSAPAWIIIPLSMEIIFSQDDFYVINFNIT